MSLLRHIGRGHAASSRRGFSLIEMLVALAVMGLALSVLYQSAAGSTRGSVVSSELSQALALAESTLEDFSSQLTIGKQEQGQFGSFRWQATASSIDSLRSQTPDAAGESPALLALVTVTVSWPSGPREREVVLTTIGSVVEPPNEA